MANVTAQTIRAHAAIFNTDTDARKELDRVADLLETGLFDDPYFDALAQAMYDAENQARPSEWPHVSEYMRTAYLLRARIVVAKLAVDGHLGGLR